MYLKCFKKRKWLIVVSILAAALFMSASVYSAKLDLNCDGKISLSDVIIVLKVVSSNSDSGLCQKIDVNADTKVGIEEAIYGLHDIAGLNPVRTAAISGQVTGSGGLFDVTVSAGGASAKTDVNGYYTLETVDIPNDGRLIVTFDKPGYATYQRSLLAEPGKQYVVSGKLVLNSINEKSVDPTQEQPLEARDSSGTLRTKLTLPADSLEGAAAGNVKVSVANGDPSTADGRAAFPGDYMAASATSGPDTPLVSVAFAEITLTDSEGKEIKQLKKPAEITLRLPDEFQTGGANAGTYVPGDPEKGFIEWWSYDETTGAWVREDADPETDGLQNAKVEDIGGVLYATGKVTHFTWWNIDKPVNEHACLCVIVQDDKQVPIPGIEVYAKGISYSGNSASALTDAQGKACVTVKRSTSPAAPDTVQMIARLGSAEFVYDVTSSTEGNIETNAVKTPTVEGSTLLKTGTCVTLDNPIILAFNGVIQGTVTHEGNNAPVPNFSVMSNIGVTGKTDETGFYSMNVPINTEILLFVPGLPGRKVVVLDPAVPKIENFVIPNRSPIIDSVTRKPEGKVDPGKQVTFTASAHDEDGDPLTFDWKSSAGTFGNPTTESGTSSIVWTAPQGIGTAIITVTVSDNRNGKTAESRSAAWGGGLQESLKMTIKDSPKSNKPVQDVYVILHGTDGKRSVQNYIKTTADGVADFGTIGRNRATISIAYALTTQYYTFRYIKTYGDVLVGDIVYYIGTGVTSDCPQDSPKINVNLEWENNVPPPGLTYTTMQPIYGYSQDHLKITNATVCPMYIQNDGMISFIVQSQTGSYPDQKIAKYGFLTDQTIIPDGTYTVQMNRTPIDVTFNTQPPTPVNFFNVNGIRKGLSHSISQGGEHHHQATSPFGMLQIPNEFPMEYYQVSAMIGNEWAGTQLTITKNYDTIPQYVLVPVPNFSFGTQSYDKTAQKFTWTTTGTMEKDWFNLSLWFQSADTQANTSWEVHLNGTAASWTLPALPEEIAGWAKPDKISTFTLGVTDVDIYSGFDDMWFGLISGINTNAQSGRMVHAASQGTIAKRESTPSPTGQLIHPLQHVSGLNRF